MTRPWVVFSVVTSLTLPVLDSYRTHIGEFDYRHILVIAFITWSLVLGAVTVFCGSNLCGCRLPSARPFFG
jgi:hypothetical protein